MHELIQQKLKVIEQERQVRVLYACESGSRAWGFPSPDSDWDVRFIYVCPPEWYVTVTPRRDVIELPINDDLDINGWELRKALNLMRKSNPPLLEWLDSPIVYQQDDVFLAELDPLKAVYFSKKSCTYHYLSMARNNYKEFMKGDTVKLKKYLYILRPVLACLWLERQEGPAPIRFETLVDTLLDGALREDIRQLVATKKQMPEIGMGPKIPRINAFLEEQMPRLMEAAKDFEPGSAIVEPADQLLRATIKRVWSA